MGRLAEASRIRLRAKALNYWHAIHRHYLNSANPDKFCTEKNSIQVNALNKYSIFELQKFCWCKKNFLHFFNARYVQLAELLHSFLAAC